MVARRMVDLTAILGVTWAVFWLSGCRAGQPGAASARAVETSSHGRGGTGMQFYVPKPSDPDWLVKAGVFHGHLGPWVTVGAMVGQDALGRLDTPGHWRIAVICWMPPENQHPPFSCVLDGLQAASGATMGKRNIRFMYSPEVVRQGRPAVYVLRQAEHNRPAAGLSYRINDRLAALLADLPPDRLEAISRQIAHQDVDACFEIRPLTEEELASVQAQSQPPSGHGHPPQTR